ncbi:MAG: cupin domain-containing protein [Gemmatimonadetes bacterium]|nr:cupin domain-containing protein [Gemmatimonadota bacterium]
MQTNLFSQPAGPIPEEVVEVLASSAGVRIERIVSQGHASPPGLWYNQAENEWVAVLTGSARLTLRDPDETLDLRDGDYVLIRAHRPHRVDWTQPDRLTVWLAVFY